MSTVQLDYNLPERFDLEFVDSEGARRRPVVIHRAMLGSIERFLGVVIEHFGGAFPVWLAPVQAEVIPIADPPRRVRGVGARSAGVGGRPGARRRSQRTHERQDPRRAQLMKTPYMLVVGDKEAEAEGAAVRLRSGEDLGLLPVADVTSRIADEAARRA